MLERARADGLDVGADQYPYTAAATTLTTILPPALLGLGIEAAVAALGDRDVRDRVRSEIVAGISGWENVAADPGWDGHPHLVGVEPPGLVRPVVGELGDGLDPDPADVAFDALVDDRMDVAVVIDCMTERGRRSIMAVPGSRCAPTPTGRRPGHAVLDAGRPHPEHTAAPPGCSARTSAIARR